ncbi:drug/metabolite transporter (DMT)-like permease [Luteibacter sp. Sphag1AF]|uniref:DMT family transporter n=1 Tax=Luteibacter sp. Sphag1AF TaxID=2587031 RepID=UPI001621C503|nr:DMT family transporter [Luteibacter sp. Sphag1AF]MBB3226719.1 drug/metabolite transporter (DMT)-like permease [Luteibacter sp. Sphag1AF]
MLYIVLAVAFSVTVSVLLKLARRAGVDVVQAIATNYIVASALSVALLHPSLDALKAPDAPLAALGLLGILLPSIFVVLAYSVRRAGIVRSDVAQRLSLFLPLIAAFAFFGDTLTWHKGAGIAAGVVAVVLILMRSERSEAKDRAGWLLPLGVFAGFGVIDILFKRVALAGAPFPSAMLASFLIAAVLCWLAVICRAVAGHSAIHWRNIGMGVVLGGANFANILFYIKGHQAVASQPSLVFSSMNIGVVVLGTLVGALAFRERLSRLNIAGIVLAVVAIVIIATA